MIFVGTWNILADQFVECEYYNCDCSILNANIRRSKIYKIIRQMNLDILLLQEVSKSEFILLKEEFKEYSFVFSKHRKNHWRGYNRYESNGNVIMFKTDKFSTLGCNFVTIHNNGNRIPILKLLYENVEFNLISFHFDDTQLNVEECKNMQRCIDNSIWICGGDTNDSENILNSIFFNFDCAHLDTSFYEGKRINIDKIFLKGIRKYKVQNKKWSNRFNSESILEELGSDHLPVFVSIFLNKIN